jgi:hypothetical protein
MIIIALRPGCPRSLHGCGALIFGCGKFELSFKSSSTMVVANQILLVLLTTHKNQVAKRDGWDKVPVVKVLVRDGVLMFIIITGWSCSIYTFQC